MTVTLIPCHAELVTHWSTGPPSRAWNADKCVSTTNRSLGSVAFVLWEGLYFYEPNQIIDSGESCVLLHTVVKPVVCPKYIYLEHRVNCVSVLFITTNAVHIVGYLVRQIKPTNTVYTGHNNVYCFIRGTVIRSKLVPGRNVQSGQTKLDLPGMADLNNHTAMTFCFDLN